MVVLISADLEGASVVSCWEEVTPEGAGYPAARAGLEQDVNAAVQSAVAAGARRVRVVDAHAGMHNLRRERVDARAELLVGSGKELPMLQGVDEAQAVVLLGCHARAGTPQAVLDHTYASRQVYRLELGGREAGEILLNAALAGAYGVPVVAVAGDRAACAEAAAELPGVALAEVKQWLGPGSARLLPPEEARRRLAAAVQDGLARREVIPPVRLEPPVTCRVDFFTVDQAERASAYPESRRTGARTVEIAGRDTREAFRGFRIMLTLAGGP